MFRACFSLSFVHSCFRRSRGDSSWRGSKPLTPSRSFSCTRTAGIMELSGFTEAQMDVREAVSKICSQFPDEYWAERDQTGEYPRELHAALARNGWIGIALPEELGGAGLGISEATMMLQTISQSGAGIAGAQSIHANVYATQPVAKSATEEQRKRMLPRLIDGEWKACFGVTEPRLGYCFHVSPGTDDSMIDQQYWTGNAQIEDACYP